VTRDTQENVARKVPLELLFTLLVAVPQESKAPQATQAIQETQAPQATPAPKASKV